MPDEQYLYEKLSGRELLEFAGEMHGLDRATTRDRIARETQRFELAGFLDNLTETYSHGMRQRLVFAIALLHDPQVLVVDEPMVGLDPRSARVVKDLLRAEAAAGKTVLMSTHTLAVAEEIADRIGILNRGQLDFLGTLAELRQELSAPHQALEHLFLELTNGHASPDAGGTSLMTNRPPLRLSACLRRKPSRGDSSAWSGGSCGRSSPRDLPPPASATRW